MKIDLLSVLRENGTGLLEGFCRLQKNNHFANYRFIDLECSKKVRMHFSLGIESLGFYEVKVDSIDHMDIKCTLIKESAEDPEVYFRIKIISCDDDFGRFLAYLSNR